jgi:hypothetical protein
MCALTERRRQWALVENARIVEESLAPPAQSWRRQARLAAGGGRSSFLPVAAAPDKLVAFADGAIEIELDGVKVRVDAAPLLQVDAPASTMQHEADTPTP